MKFAYVYDHHNAGAEWSRRDLQEWLTDIFEAPHLKIGERCTPEIRQHVQGELEKEGWAINVKIDQSLGLTVFAIRKDMAFQLQTGNMSRAPYDLLKLQYLYTSDRIEAAALAMPTKECADRIGSNVANAERICNELQLFNRIITIPILVVAFN
jgi:restriction endonuclease BglII